MAVISSFSFVFNAVFTMTPIICTLRICENNFCIFFTGSVSSFSFFEELCCEDDNVDGKGEDLTMIIPLTSDV